MKCLLLFVIFGAISYTYAAPRVCVLDGNTCRSTTPVCGRSGTSTCQRFRNSCALEIANCRRSQNSTAYTKVATSDCSNLSGYQPGRCSRSSTSGSNGTNISGILSNLLGGSTSNAKPITGTISNVKQILSSISNVKPSTGSTSNVKPSTGSTSNVKPIIIG